MTRRVWFAYEAGPAGQPMPVIFFDEIPTSHEKRRILKIWEINENLSEFSFYSLQALYPYVSQEETLQSPTEDVGSKETQMVRPVEGFMTKQGKFFDTEAEADFYEAAYALNKAAAAEVVAIGVSGGENIEEVVKELIAFISFNRHLVTEYLRARRTLEEQQASHDLDGPPAEDNPPDDPPIRSEPDTQVAETPTTEADSETTGEPLKQAPV